MLNKALDYFESKHFNVLPLRGKMPITGWKAWCEKTQTKENIEAMEWKNATGVGVVMGVNDIRCFDLDKVESADIVEEILRDLGLPEEYPWVIQSGSGEGYHIYFKCSLSSKGNGYNPFSELRGERAVFKYNMKKEGICDHIELRWKDCQTALPPSMHESGGSYSYFYSVPTDPPEIVDAKIVISCIKKHCLTSGPKEAKQAGETQLNFDRERLESALTHLSKKLTTGNYDDWIGIGFGLAPLGKTGEDYFVKMSLDNPNYKDTEDAVRLKFKNLLNDYDGTTTIRTVYRIAENYGWQKPVIHFWYLDSREQVKISRTRFKRFLESEGFCKVKKDSSYLFVRIVNNVVEEIDGVHVKDFVMEYLYSLPAEEFEDVSRTDVVDALIKGANQYFTNQFFEFLITRRIDFRRDTAIEGYLFYDNGYVTVTAGNIQLIDYKDMDGYVWAKQIIKREYHPTKLRSDFEDFVHNICRKDVCRTRALKSAIGFLLHTYKDPNIAKAVVLIDEKISEGSYGRSGKGLVIKAISKLRTVVVEDGRNFNIGKNFAMQRVNADTNIIAIEDMKENAQFDRFYSIITEGVTVEKKQRDEIFISFSESPKLVISTNFSIKGFDDSSKDRQHLIEFSDHYNKNNRPVDEFGKLFFEGWTEQDWSAFDNYFIECLQLYLSEGLLTYDYVNIERKQIINETREEFAEFGDALILNNVYDKKDLFEQFKKDYPDFEKLSQGKFTRWLKIWSKVKNVEVVETKSGASRTIEFRDPKLEFVPEIALEELPF